MVGVSIIICCYNSQERLPLLFSFINRIDIETKKVEIILVNNSSTDRTFEIGLDLINSSKFSGKVIQESKPGLSNARKAGVFSALFNLVLFCDDDNWLFPDYLKIGLDYFSKYPMLGCLGGYGIPSFDIPPPAWFDTFSNSYALGSLGKKDGLQPSASIHYGAGLFFNKKALCSFYSKGVASSISGRSGGKLFAGDDSELCFAIQLEGYNLGYLSNLKFQHRIESFRLSESYYLNLRKGILSNFPILESYSFLLAKRRTGFISSYFLRIPALTINFLKTFLKYLVSRDFVHQVQYLIYWWKMRGLILNFRTSYKLYKDLKSKYSL